MGEDVRVLYHFSEDRGIERFVPHVPVTNPGYPPAVWAIDAEHSPLYWFPRDCPRAAVWTSADLTHKTPRRIHTVERAWKKRLRTTTVFCYGLPTEPFVPWPEADGQFIATGTVVPISVEPLGDLVALHEAAGIELALLRHRRNRVSW